MTPVGLEGVRGDDQVMGAARRAGPAGVRDQARMMDSGGFVLSSAVAQCGNGDMTDLVWYVSYGSNMSAHRFHCYLRGGQPPGSALTCPGARDHTPPRAGQAVWLPGSIYFATRSQAWGGGRALYDPAAPGRAAARAYLITAQQFSDVVAQEMYREPGADLDLAGLAGTGQLRIGPGRYETLLHVGEDAGAPMVTFTAPWAMGDKPYLPPSAAYLRMLGQGLREAHGWSSQRAAEYLAGLPGAQGSWATADIASLL